MDEATLKAGFAVILPHIGGLWAGRITAPQIKGWYKNLKKPSWTPPSSAFAPVWATLYTSMGISSYLVYSSAKRGEATLPLALYGTQLALNWLWTPLFFKYHCLKLSAIEITLLTGTAAATGYTFFRVNSMAGLLFIPYVAWLSLATALNYRIYLDNDINSKRRSKK